MKSVFGHYSANQTFRHPYFCRHFSKSFFLPPFFQISYFKMTIFPPPTFPNAYFLKFYSIKYMLPSDSLKKTSRLWTAHRRIFIGNEKEGWAKKKWTDIYKRLQRWRKTRIFMSNCSYLTYCIWNLEIVFKNILNFIRNLWKMSDNSTICFTRFTATHYNWCNTNSLIFSSQCLCQKTSKRNLNVKCGPIKREKKLGSSLLWFVRHLINIFSGRTLSFWKSGWRRNGRKSIKSSDQSSNQSLATTRLLQSIRW